jgi:phospholipid-binding lipoprotein MlaA
VVGCARGPSPVETKTFDSTKPAAESQGVAGKSSAGESTHSDDLLKEYEADDAAGSVTVADPLRPWNVACFHFNDKFYFWLLKPVSKGYGYILYPRFVRIGIKNVLDNLGFPGRFLNSLLQARPKAASTELGRFLMNSTVGVVGLWDPASYWCHWKIYNEDFDQTLGVWGMGMGFYLSWPFVGPCSGRGTLGLASDYFLNPIMSSSAGIALSQINNTSLGLNGYEDLLTSALEPYSAIRSAYVQNRAEEITK